MSAPRFFVHRSNRSELLVDALADVLREPLADPFGPEVIVVHSRGMERWLSMELAQRFGVFSNARFPFPRHIIEEILGEPAFDDSPFAPGQLLWHVAACLPELLSHAAFLPLCRYLASDAEGQRLVQLSQRIAEVFDQYLVYRPEMMLSWSRGEGSEWQPRLWRAVLSRMGSRRTTFLSERARTFIVDMRRGAEPPSRVPERIVLFGIVSLPPLYLQVLAALSERVAVHLLLLSPCREYWADVSARQPSAGAPDTEDPRSHHAGARALLASLGQLGREFQQVLEEFPYIDGSQSYREPQAPAMLSLLQADLLHLRSRGAPEGPLALSVADDDASISVHDCHSPLREVQVLRDQLLAMLDEDATLQPHDIMVMTPDIEAYAPFIEAGFGADASARSIPFRIADRGLFATHDIVDAFGRLLDVLQGRFGASQVLDLLSADAVRERFAIGIEQLGTLRSWCADSGVRWAVDAAHRAQVGQPALHDNTWRFGLERLFLGYAMGDTGSGRLFQGVRPSGEFEGGSTELLGAFADFVERLFAWRERLRAPRTLDAWCESLQALLSDMLAEGGLGAHQHEQLRVALMDVATRAADAGFDAQVGLATARAQLERALGERAPAHGFLSGGVTFCQLVPMRSIPFRVVCLIGMSHDAFPRMRRPLSFDEMASAPRPGDRSVRADDRYLFLEAVLAARERLWISYVGQDMRDNRRRPPSVVVAELLDALDQSFVPQRFDPRSPEGQLCLAMPPHAERSDVESRVVVRHPLQQFSPRYFTGEDRRLFSYSPQAASAARRLVAGRRSPDAFFSEPLGDEESPIEVSLDELERWLIHPVRSLLQRRLGLYLGHDLEPLAEREPVQLERLERWKLGDDLLGAADRGAEHEQLVALAHATGRLPPGTPGEIDLAEVVPLVEGLSGRMARYTGAAERLPPLAVDIELEGVRVLGVIHNLWPNVHAEDSFSRLGATGEQRHFIRHVVLNYVVSRGESDLPRESVLVGPEGAEPAEVRLGPISDPAGLLREMLSLFVAARRAPLPIFPGASLRYAEQYAADQDGQAAMDAARRAYRGRGSRDATDPYLQRVWPEGPRFDEEFARYALRSYAAWWAAREVVS